MHNKGLQKEETTKLKTRRVIKAQRPVAGATVEMIKAKRNERPEVREAAREHAAVDNKKRDEREAQRRQEKAAAASARADPAKFSKMQAR